MESLFSFAVPVSRCQQGYQVSEGLCGPYMKTSENRRDLRNASRSEPGNLIESLVCWKNESTLEKLRRRVNKLLTVKPSADLSLHRAILTLARNREGLLRLITTNFDDAFERAGCSEEESDTAPRLPVPKSSTWQSLVHLHGRIY